MSGVIDRFYTVQGLLSGSSWVDLYSCSRVRSLSHALSELDGCKKSEKQFLDYRIVVDERKVLENDSSDSVREACSTQPDKLI